VTHRLSHNRHTSRSCVEESAASALLCDQPAWTAATDAAFVLQSVVVPDAPPSPLVQSQRLPVMRNRAGSFSVEMRARQGSFHL
jgi:hypothetical protein